MKLGALFYGIPVLEKIHWDPHLTVKKITSDSRALAPGDLFVACPGSRMDGHDFLGEAILAKASVIIFERAPEFTIPSWVTALRVPSSTACLAGLLNRFYHHPDRTVHLVGVTGTNGKTTTAFLIHQLLREKTRAAYVGTLWYDLAGSRTAAPNTTPGAEILIPLLDQMAREKVRFCVMEVSSHALEQHRVHGLRFELAIFTQLTQDHLDYHKNMEHYFQAKRLLFSQDPGPRQVLINRDDPYGRRLIAEHPEAKTLSLTGPADYRAREIETSFQGSRFKLEWKGREIPFQIRLPMPHNVANVLAVLAGLDMLGYDPADFRGTLAEIPGIPGRMERVPGSGAFQVFVDYAHTPDAIENVLREARRLKPRRILTLFGCGGDRDRTKRPLMGEAAHRWSDILVLTSDNPRSEDPEAIVEEIKGGIPVAQAGGPEVIEILDRRAAIERLVSLAEPGDVLFVLGKGHEDYQILGERKIPFDDRLVVGECLKRKSETRVFFS